MYKYLVINVLATTEIKEKLEKLREVGLYVTDSKVVFLIRFTNLWEISRLNVPEIIEKQKLVGIRKPATILSPITSTSIKLS